MCGSGDVLWWDIVKFAVGLGAAAFGIWLTQHLVFLYQHKAHMFQLKHETYLDFLKAFSDIKNEALRVPTTYSARIEAERAERGDAALTGLIRPDLHSTFLDARQRCEMFLTRFTVFDCEAQLQTALQELMTAVETMSTMDRKWFVKDGRTDTPAADHMRDYLHLATCHFGAIVEKIVDELFPKKTRG